MELFNTRIDKKYVSNKWGSELTRMDQVQCTSLIY